MESLRNSRRNSWMIPRQNLGEISRKVPQENPGGNLEKRQDEICWIISGEIDEKIQGRVSKWIYRDGILEGNSRTNSKGTPKRDLEEITEDIIRKTHEEYCKNAWWNLWNNQSWNSERNLGDISKRIPEGIPESSSGEISLGTPGENLESLMQPRE